ncbi:MAG: ABC transporter ATP-binding protein [Acidobacteria bacterium]|nr:MAG: ABC transporter ATP-binding protein [Acidobacteriota bacterium]
MQRAPASPDLAIETRMLGKIFGSKVAVRGLTLEVPRGEVFGFLGPNGAGKSTSIKMMLGLIAPTRGEALVLGVPAGDVSVRRKIGFLPEHFRFYEWLTAAELLGVHGRLYGMSKSRLRERIPELLNDVGLWPHREKRVRDFSKGMMQRLGLAQALLNEPDLIFLDEPTSGLDPAGRKLVRDIIRAQRDRGATVFLNSHLLGEVEVTCDRVSFIKNGEVLETRRLGARVEDEVTVTMRARNLSPETLSALEQLVSSLKVADDGLTFYTRSMDALPGIVRFLVSQNVDVYEITPQRLSLEDLFLRIVGPDGGL